MRNITIYGFILLCQLIFSHPIYAWQLPIEVATYTDKGDKVYNKLVAGMESGATDGFDNLWDTQALLTSPDPEDQPMLRAYFIPAISLPLDGGGSKGGGVDQYLWKDTRGAVKGNTTWNITIDSVPPGKMVVLSWDTPDGMLKAGERLALKDNDSVDAGGQPVLTDVTQASNYVFVSDGEGPRSLALVLSRESSSTSHSGGGSGFGCGTVKFQGNGPSDGGASAVGVIVLFLPLLILRLLRLSLSLRCSRNLSNLKR